jgi:predicted HAD superfamily Cof-like phosphohydrolase
MTNFEMVREFHKTFSLPIADSPQDLSEERTWLRNGFIVEELIELLVAQGYDPAHAEVLETVLNTVRQQRPQRESTDLVAVADALTDILYFVYGSFVEIGIDADKCFAEVHRSNMSKLDENGNVIWREDGKVMKSSLYSPPQLEQFVYD